MLIYYQQMLTYWLTRYFNCVRVKTSDP